MCHYMHASFHPAGSTNFSELVEYLALEHVCIHSIRDARVWLRKRDLEVSSSLTDYGKFGEIISSEPAMERLRRTGPKISAPTI